MTRKEQIKSAYKLTGSNASFYDGMMTYSTLPGKAICRIVWNMDGEKNLRYLEKALSGIPEDFSGKLLEVPVGTGVLTMPVYRDLPDADITCLDYSENMMASAQEKAKALGLTNISFLQGDVGALPFADETFDIVLSLNGFHAFPDKEAAYRETFRVLKKGGVFCGCFYIRGECRRTDFFVNRLYVPKGFFTPPFETKGGLQCRLSGMYSDVQVTSVEGIGCFKCGKEQLWNLSSILGKTVSAFLVCRLPLPATGSARIDSSLKRAFSISMPTKFCSTACGIWS